MKLCFSSLGCPQDTVDALIARMSALGAQAVELRTLESTVELWKLADFGPGAIAQTRQKFENAGLAVAVVGTSGCFANADPASRLARIEMLERYADVAAGLGCPYLRVFGGPVPAGQSRAQALQNDIEGYSMALDALRGYPVQLLFETHDDFSRSDWMLPLVAALPGTGVIWDILHPYRFGEPMEETWARLGPYVRHVHIKDSAHFSPTGFDIAHIGQGSVPVKTALQLLKNAGYDGCLCYEWEKHWHPDIDSADIAFPRYIAYMRAAL